MLNIKNLVALFLVLILNCLSLASASSYSQGDNEDHHHFNKQHNSAIQLGPRPYYLVNDMDAGQLKDDLLKCSKNKLFKKSDFSIGHRGAAMQFPEHTRESYVAAARMGAGILECDVSFTKDKELVCRHSQCDLHTTTNILATPLAAKCSIPFTPATFDNMGNLLTPATAQCCTSDLTLAEFKSLKGKMDAGNAQALNVEEYLDATPNWRTDLYSQNGTLMTHAESIELFKSLGVKMTPELKAPSVEMPYQGNYSQEDYAQHMIDEYKNAGVEPENVFAQSFNLGDVRYWITNEPQFGQQAVYLDGRYDDQSFDFRNPQTWSPNMEQLADMGVQYIAPPMWMLLDTDHQEQIKASIYSQKARAANLNIITWTLERSGLLANGGGWYYQSMQPIIDNDGDMFTVLDVLAQDVGVVGVFSDWPATVTFYANCKETD